MGNDRLTGRVIGIEIDEGKEIIDLSDHNLIEVRIRGDRIEKEKRKQREQVKYYSLGKEELREYVKGVERRVQEHRIEDIRKFNRTIEEVAGQKLERTYTRRVGKETGNKEPPWVTEEIKREIKERKRLNRITRNTDSEEEKARF